MRKIFLFIFPLIIFSQEVYLRLTDYSLGKTKIVIQDFKVLSNSENIFKERDILSLVIQQDLDYSLYFDIFRDTLFLSVTKERSAVILYGEMRDKEVKVYLKDFSSNSIIFEKTYIKGEIRELAHKISDDIIWTITGEKGISTTKIVFSYRKGRGKELGIIDYDGENFREITDNGNLNLFPEWDRFGKYILFSNYMIDRLSLNLYDIETGKIDNLFSYTGLNYSPSFSPDGENVCLTMTKDGNAELYLYNIKNNKLLRLTFNNAIDCSPSFSPNGREIAFVSDRSGTPQIYVMDVDGSNTRRLTFYGDYNTSPAWSPRGNLIAYVSREKDNTQQIYITDPNNFYPMRLTYRGNNEEPSFSPDGLHIVFISDRDGKYELWTMNWNGTRQKKLFERFEVYSPAWSPFKR